MRSAVNRTQIPGNSLFNQDAASASGVIGSGRAASAVAFVHSGLDFKAGCCLLG